MQATWNGWKNSADTVLSQWDNAYSKKSYVAGSGTLPMGAEFFKQRVDDLLQKANSMQKPPASDKKFYHQLTKLNTIAQTLNAALYNDAATTAQVAQSTDDNFIKNVYPSYEATVNNLVQQWNSHKNGSKKLTKQQLSVLENTLGNTRDAILNKAEELKKLGRTSSSTKMEYLYNRAETTRQQVAFAM